MKRIFVVCPTARDLRELGIIQSKHSNVRFIFDEFTTKPIDELLYDSSKNYDFSAFGLIVDQITQRAQAEKVDGILCSIDYPGSLIASVVAHNLGLPAPHIYSMLLCMHKYYARIVHQRNAWFATPHFSLIDPLKFEHINFSYPFFLKPVKASLSINANQINSFEEFTFFLQQSMMPQQFLEPFNYFITTYTSFKFNGNYLLAESLLQGSQCTLEGFVYKGSITFIGITDSIMYPNTICFERFEYPSALPFEIQHRMMRIAQRIIHAIGFNNGLFNIEFMYNPILDRIDIIEVNPRMAPQFADLYEKVTGFNSYTIALDIALGQKPRFNHSQGNYPYAASCVLRLFEDKITTKIPTLHEIHQLHERYPDIRIEIYAKEGKKLSDLKQDTKSFMYCIINVGAATRQGLIDTVEYCKSMLKFEFEA